MSGIEILRAVTEGMVGAILFLAFRFWIKDFENTENWKERTICRIIMGAIVGYLWLMRGLPNSFNTVMAGMLAPEIIEGFSVRFKKKYDESLIPVENEG